MRHKSRAEHDDKKCYSTNRFEFSVSVIIHAYDAEVLLVNDQRTSEQRDPLTACIIPLMLVVNGNESGARCHANQVVMRRNASAPGLSNHVGGYLHTVATSKPSTR